MLKVRTRAVQCACDRRVRPVSAFLNSGRTQPFERGRANTGDYLQNYTKGNTIGKSGYKTAVEK